MQRPERADAAQPPLPGTTKHRRYRSRWPGVALGLACIGGFGAAHAARWSVEPTLDMRATWTDNANFASSGGTSTIGGDRAEKESDTILEMTPSVALRGEGKRFRINGNVGATGLTYVNGTRDSRALPAVNLNANLEAIERRFFIDAGVLTRQLAEDVFAPRAGGASDFNTITTTQYRVEPSFVGRLGGDVEYRLSSFNSWTDTSGAESELDAQYLGEHRLRIEDRPTPFGWVIEGARSDTRFESANPDSIVIDSGRLTLLYALTNSFTFGVRGGYESTNLVTQNADEVIYGVNMAWRPSERTDLNATWEHRFFGNGWQLRFNHRMPRLAWALQASRDVVSFPQAFLTLPATNDIAGLLDAAFTTRFPDPTERARVVADLMARQGLPASTSTEISLFAQQVSLVTSRDASIAYLGVRNSVVLTAFSRRTEAVPDSVFDPAALLQSARTDGVSLTFSHQITPLTSLTASAGYNEIEGVGVNAGANSKQKSMHLQVTRQVAPKTTAYIGARVQRFDSNVDVENARENAAFIGAAHRF